MSALREAAEMALDAFDSMIGRKPERVETAITAIRTALASQTVPSDYLDSQQPVAWLGFNPRSGVPEFAYDMPAPSVMRDFKMRPLVYGDTATPPQRKLIDDKTLWEMWVESPSDVLRFARAIERAHGIGGEE